MTTTAKEKQISNENKHKHLELIQGVINRLAVNSFWIKGWSIVLLSAFFAFAANERHPIFSACLVFSLIVLWMLDGLFLQWEKLYRKLYNHVRSLDEDQIDFSMDTTPFETDHDLTLVKIMRSKTLLCFHGLLVLGTSFSLAYSIFCCV